MSQTHTCSPCGFNFNSEAEYLSHECEAADGEMPVSLEFLGKTTTHNVYKIAEIARARGQLIP